MRVYVCVYVCGVGAPTKLTLLPILSILPRLTRSLPPFAAASSIPAAAVAVCSVRVTPFWTPATCSLWEGTR